MTAQIIDIATRRVTLVGPIARTMIRLPYTVEVVPNEDGVGFDYAIFTGSPNVADEPDPDDVAADLASIASSLSPPPRTFLERLKALFTGD